MWLAPRLTVSDDLHSGTAGTVHTGGRRPVDNSPTLSLARRVESATHLTSPDCLYESIYRPIGGQGSRPAYGYEGDIWTD